MLFKEFLDSVCDEYEKAKEKHPYFCDKFTDMTLPYVKNCESAAKFVNDNNPTTAVSILKEEILEALVAYLENDKEHCLQELAQCCAVIFRMAELVNREL